MQKRKSGNDCNRFKWQNNFQHAGNADGNYIFGKTFAPGEYFVRVDCGNLNRTIKIIKAN
jgi:hypothetical protein